MGEIISDYDRYHTHTLNPNLLIIVNVLKQSRRAYPEGAAVVAVKSYN